MNLKERDNLYGIITRWLYCRQEFNDKRGALISLLVTLEQAEHSKVKMNQFIERMNLDIEKYEEKESC